MALQLGVVQMRPITPPRTYDVDLVVLRGTDTLAMPLLRLADGLEGRLMLSQVSGPSLLLRTTVLQEKESGCHVLTVRIGQVSQQGPETIFIPQTTGRLCGGVELLRMGRDETPGQSLSPVVVARVRPNQ